MLPQSSLEAVEEDDVPEFIENSFDHEEIKPVEIQTPETEEPVADFLDEPLEEYIDYNTEASEELSQEPFDGEQVNNEQLESIPDEGLGEDLDDELS